VRAERAPHWAYRLEHRTVATSRVDAPQLSRKRLEHLHEDTPPVLPIFISAGQTACLLGRPLALTTDRPRDEPTPVPCG